jgi:hypothetical protein
VYVQLLSSSELLEPVARETVTVRELGDRRVSLMDLLEVPEDSPPRRLARTVTVLKRLIDVREVRPLGTVAMSVTTRWPSVSLALADRLLADVNRFNIEQRQSQAASERHFADTLAGDAERALRSAEDRLQAFLQQNRGFISSPQLQFERDRLQRDVSLRQQLYTTLLQSREDARIREVRTTPVITILENPRLAAFPESRRVVLKTLLGFIVGLTAAVLAALLWQVASRSRETDTNEAREFAALVQEATPRFLRRRRA